MKRVAATIAGGLALSGCATGTAPTRPAVGIARPLPYTGAGLDAVMGKDAAQLTRTFGAPMLDVREGTARKLQFGGAICVLDAYLYPKGQAQVVTYFDARQTDGSPIDRASCVAALTKRPGGK